MPGRCGGRGRGEVEEEVEEEERNHDWPRVDKVPRGGCTRQVACCRCCHLTGCDAAPARAAPPVSRKGRRGLR